MKVSQPWNNIWYLSKARLSSRHANTIQIMKMCQAFSDHRLKVTLITCRERGVLIPLNPYDYGVEGDFRIKTLSWHNIRGFGLVYSFFAALLARLGGARIIYTRDIQLCFFCRLFRLPVVLEWHAAPVGFSARLWTFLCGFRNRRLIHIFISRALYEDVVSVCKSISVRVDVSAVLPDGVDCSAFKGRGSDRKTTQMSTAARLSPAIVGYVGGFYKGRGIEEVILPLSKHFQQIEFHIVGGPLNLAEHLRQTVNAQGLHNVVVKDFVPNSEVPALLQSFAVLLAPYQSQIETSGGGNTARWASPLKLFEYMASGVPFIVSDLPVFREILDEDVCMICAPTVLTEWIDSLEQLLSNSNLAAVLADRAQLYASQYDWSHRAKKILDML